MALSGCWIRIAGCGPGSPGYVTQAAREAALSAEVLVGAPRLLELFSESAAERVPVGADVEAVLNAIAAFRGRRVTVLVTGDPGLCSLAQPVVRRFGADACEMIAGVSSVQVAFARVGHDWLGARIVNAHGKTPCVNVAELGKAPAIAVLAGTPAALSWAAKLALKLEPRRIVVCEDLTLESERVREVTAAELAVLDAASRSIVLLLKEGDRE